MSASHSAEQRVGGEIAGKYRLLRLLGAGGMGAVYEAVHQFTQRRVALKLMHPSFARSGVAAERFVREAQAPTSIGHPGIVEVLDGGRDRDGSLYLVLELLEGETLAHAMKAATLDLDHVGAIALALLDALQAAHAAGFVHRDIKPDNVFLVSGDGARPRVKLLDFGVAGVLAGETEPGLTLAGSLLGTPLYMSPEQAMGRRADARSDLWSMGAMLYQALSGRPPFEGESFHALVVSISTQEYLPLSVLRPELPVRVVSVIERALHKNVEQRWQSAADMSAAFARALERGRRGRTKASPHAEPNLPEAAIASVLRAPEARATAPGWLLPAVFVAALVIGAAVFAALRPARGVPEGAVLAGSQLDAVGRTALATDPDPKSSSDPDLDPGPDARSGETLSGVAAPPAPQGLSSEQLAHVLQSHDRELQRCYEEAIVGMLMQTGADAPQRIEPMRLDLRFEVEAVGSVRNVHVDGSAGPELKRCMVDCIAAWRFPRSAVPTQVRLPVIFRPNIVQR